MDEAPLTTSTGPPGMDILRTLGRYRARAEAVLAVHRDRLARAEGERQSLRERLAEADARLAALAQQATAAPPDDTSQADDDLHRLHEMALDDLRELKARNAELEQQLRATRAAGPSRSAAAPAFADTGGMDWEAQKRRLLAALEAEPDEEQEAPEGSLRRLEIQEVIDRTNAVVADKDRQLAELRQLLEDQSKVAGSMALGAAAIGQVLDDDAVIQDERENLRRLRAECREKLRQAEIDLSLERAKLARERSQLEEKLRELAAHPPAGDPNAHKSAASTRGRWLARLGLKDPEG